jgi:hypothetical protein
LSKWKFRILQIDDAYGTGYCVETDRGTQEEQWYSVYKTDDLEKARAVKSEREAKTSLEKTVTVIE